MKRSRSTKRGAGDTLILFDTCVGSGAFFLFKFLNYIIFLLFFFWGGGGGAVQKY